MFANLNKLNLKQAATLKDKLVLVDTADKRIGPIEKGRAHEISFINGPDGNPHRAFSVFLFNENYELLMQQRSAVKILFPNYWANTVCSHPQLNQNYIPALKARLQFELNINLDKIWNNADVRIHFASKVLYKAEYDEDWGEYELDYVFFIKDFKQDWLVNLVNPDEVQDIRWISRSEVPELLQDSEKLVSPWFRGIVEKTDFMSNWSRLEKEDRITLSDKIWDIR